MKITIPEFHSKRVPELTISFRNPRPMSKDPLIDPPIRVKYLRRLFDNGTIELRERLVLLILNDYYQPLGWYGISEGTPDMTFTDDKEVLRLLIVTGARKFIICHNHPDGCHKPSEADLRSAMTLQHKARYFDFEYVDDIILTKTKAFSFAQQDLFWENF